MLSKEELELIIQRKGPSGWIECRIASRDMAEELLSLREQLAELKALPPFAWGLADKDGNAYLSECCIGDEGCMIDEAEGYNYELEPEHHIHAVPLFTAAKPADSVTLPAPANYEDYGPMISLEKTMAALALCGIEYTVKK